MKNIIVTLFVLLLNYSSAWAENTYLDLDVAAGCFSTWRVNELAADGIDFDFTFVQKRYHEKWFPTYTMFISDAAGNAIQFQGYFPNSGDMVTKITTFKDNKEINAQSDDLLKLNLNEKYRISIRWDNAKLRLKINGNEKAYSVSFKPTTLSISCSTGEIIVQNIVFIK